MITLSSIRSKKDNRILIIKNIHTKNEFVSKNIYSETSEIFETNETKTTTAGLESSIWILSSVFYDNCSLSIAIVSYL